MSEGFDPYHKWLGIPPKDQPPNHYRLLGLEMLESDPEVIDTAASRLMSHLQELASGPEVKHSQKLLNEIAAARRCLLNSERKKAYDEQLRAKRPKASPPKKRPTPETPPEAPPAAPPKATASAPPEDGAIFTAGRVFGHHRRCSRTGNQRESGTAATKNYAKRFRVVLARFWPLGRAGKAD